MAFNGTGSNVTSLNAANISSGTLAVGRGGTGATTLNAAAVIIGNGTSAPTFVAPGTSGNVLTSNGSAWVSEASGSYAGSSIVAFYSSGTFTVPTGITQCYVHVISGGAGAASSGNIYAGRGGYALARITGLTPGDSITVTVGAGGASGVDGGTSSFGSFVSCTGGIRASGSETGISGQATLSGAGVTGIFYDAARRTSDQSGSSNNLQFAAVGGFNLTGAAETSSATSTQVMIGRAGQAGNTRGGVSGAVWIYF
jgi:hypothetical protein